MQRSNLFCPCERSEIGEVPQGEGVKKDRNYSIFLSVPATSHKRCGSTKYHNAKGTNLLRNIDVFVKYTHNIFQPLSLAQLDSSPILLRNTEEQKVTFYAHRH